MSKIGDLRQEIFNQVWAGASSQSFERAANEDGCAYRGDRGLKCNAGHLIPDERYHEDLEGDLESGAFRATTAYDRAKELKIPLNNILQLVQECQNAHDSADNPAKHQAQLRDVATEYKLTVPGAIDFGFEPGAEAGT